MAPRQHWRSFSGISSISTLFSVEACFICPEKMAIKAARRLFEGPDEAGSAPQPLSGGPPSLDDRSGGNSPAPGPNRGRGRRPCTTSGCVWAQTGVWFGAPAGTLPSRGRRKRLRNLPRKTRRIVFPENGPNSQPGGTPAGLEGNFQPDVLQLQQQR